MAKSPTRQSRQSNSPFTKQQEIWICSRCAFLSPKKLQRAFIKQIVGWKHSHKNVPPALWHLVKRFKKNGGTTSGSREPKETVSEIGRPQSVNSERYQEMLKDRVWPEIKYRSSQREYWFMQDGATSHTTNDINFLV